MDHLKVLASFSAIFIISLLLFLPFSNVEATEFYALRLSGSDCTLCHTDPKTGSLNPAGMRFQEEGYRYPITWKAMFFYFLGGLTFFLIVFSFYLRYRLWRIGKEEATWSRWKERWK
ncbi:MAG: hypothetical protein ACXU9L_10945, partial [Thermodesulfobacteriota bacterium]